MTDAVAADIAKAQASGGSSIQVTAISGTYTDAWLSDVTIAVINGKLRFTSKRSPGLAGEMLPFKANTYVVKWDDRSMDADAFINFTLDTNGQATGFTMKAISPLTDFSYDFHDLDFHRVMEPMGR